MPSLSEPFSLHVHPRVVPRAPTNHTRATRRTTCREPRAALEHTYSNTPRATTTYAHAHDSEGTPDPVDTRFLTFPSPYITQALPAPACPPLDSSPGRTLSEAMTLVKRLNMSCRSEHPNSKTLCSKTNHNPRSTPRPSPQTVTSTKPAVQT